MKRIVSNSNELLDAVKTAAATTEKVSITVENGIYEVNETLHLTGNIELVGKGNTVLKGTKKLSLKNAECKNGIYVIDLTKEGITDTGKFGLGPYEEFWETYDIPKPHMTDYGPSAELYFGEKKMNLSKYPRDGYIFIEKAVGKTDLKTSQGERNGSAEGHFIPSETAVFDNNDTDNMLLVGYWNYNWASQRHIITNYQKEEKIITVDTPYHSFGYKDKDMFSPRERGKFYILNLLSAVKEPGDWFIDRKENKLYLIPFDGQDSVEMTICENMFEAENAEDITIKNLSVWGCRKSAISFNKCKNVIVENCTFYNVGAWGAILDWCDESTVSECTVFNTGGGGIAVSCGDRNTLISGNCVVKNNTIHNISYWHRTYLAGIEINGVGVTVSENKIFDVPHFAIVFQGNEHIIEKNRIRNACCDSNDAGAIYAGRDYTCRGNIIRYNCIQDLPGCNGNGCMGIYFDDAMSSAEVYGNILSNINWAGIMLGGGRDFDIHDNFFFDCNVALHFDGRMLRDNGYYNDKLLRHLEEVPYRSEIWKKAYPELYTILEDERRAPENNIFHHNTIVGGNGIVIPNDESIEKYLKRYDNTYIQTKPTKLNFLYGEDTFVVSVNK